MKIRKVEIGEEIMVDEEVMVEEGKVQGKRVRTVDQNELNNVEVVVAD